MNYIYILFIIEAVLFLLALFLSGRDIMAPSVIMCVMFLIGTIFVILMSEQWDTHYSAAACFILTVGILTFIISEAFFRFFWRRIKRRGRNSGSVLYQNNWRILCLPAWIIFAMMVYDIGICYWYALEISRITGVTGPESFAAYRALTVHLENPYAANIERTGTLLNQLVKVVFATGYVAGFVLINNCISGRRKFWNFIGLLGIMFLSICPRIMAAARGDILQFISAMIIEYYILWHQKKGWGKNLSWKYVRVGIGCVLLGIPLFYFSTKLVGEPTHRSMLEYAAVYAGSGIWLFDDYVKQPTKVMAFGEETLIGIHRLLSRLGLPSYLRDANLEFRKIGNDLSNIYTFFRRPLHDYGLFGMVIFTMLVSAFFSWMYYRKIWGRPASFKTDCWIIVYGYLYYWIVVSSMVQYSFSYLGVGTILTIAAILIGYRLILLFTLKEYSCL